MIVDGSYVRKFMRQLCVWDRVDISLRVHSRAILKIVKCDGHTNVNSTPPTQLPHKFSYIVAIFIHDHFESPNRFRALVLQNHSQKAC
jgi:hypothetical protein